MWVIHWISDSPLWGRSGGKLEMQPYHPKHFDFHKFSSYTEYNFLVGGELPYILTKMLHC